MQYRMKTHQLSSGDMHAVLSRGQAGTLATVDPDGTPYAVPVHYVLYHDALYIHGLPAGQKISNLRANPGVCFNVYEMQGLLLDRKKQPCDTNTAYVSVVVRGRAQLIEDTGEKRAALSAIIQKYTPDLAGADIPPNMLQGTAVIRIEICEMTGKYYR